LRNGTHTTCTTAVVTWRERAARSACQFAAPDGLSLPGWDGSVRLVNSV
jgi:hypothetical protein